MSEANRLLKIAQVRALQQPDEAHFIDERNCNLSHSKIQAVEEAYFKQKSRINWLLLGDQNTSYFYKVVKARIAYNLIHTLTAMDGTVVVHHLVMGKISLDHFINILGPVVSPPAPFVFPAILQLTIFSCSDEDIAAFSSRPNGEDITRTLFKLNPNKSPGADG